jgi:hypothetical protein
LQPDLLFLSSPPPAWEGWGGGSKVKIMTVDSKLLIFS